jgi:succinate-semialdehyde dehydrogenase/glutarate-semialdehyde dehydrogenase
VTSAVSAPAINSLTDDVVRSATAVRLAGSPVSHTGTTMEISSPVGDPARTVAVGTAEHARAAVEEAAAATARWSAVPEQERASILEVVADRLEEVAEGGWARLVSRETGKRLAESVGEIRFSAGYFRVAAGTLREQGASRELDVVPGIHHEVIRQPRGVAVVLTPWNFPVSIPARKIAPALAAGCGVVFKPSEVAPLSSMVLAAVLDEYLPSGLVGTVLGSPRDVVDTWLGHPAVGTVTFTGSTRVGRLVAAAAARRFLPAVLELGGCAPFIVLPDADPQTAVEALMVAKFRNNGQSCIAANQVFVAREVAGPVLDLLRKRVAALRVGDPLDPATEVGPLAPAQDPARLEALVQDALDRGATVVRSDGRPPERGHYVAPALLLDASPDSTAMREEVFGPVAPVHVFEDLDEVRRLHHATGFGLAAYICSSEDEGARDLAASLNAGIVGVNTGTPNTPYVPFGGRSNSGFGYEGGREGVEFFQAAQVRATVVR